jgi:hypothetical protein
MFAALRLALLAPGIVEAILHGRRPAELQPDRLLRRSPVGRREQRTVHDAAARRVFNVPSE